MTNKSINIDDFNYFLEHNENITLKEVTYA